eukprot:5892135-Ditylum_brightwellii.AAC.1
MEDCYLITTLHSLALLDKQVIGAILGTETTTFLVRRKFSIVTELLRKGENLSSSITTTSSH